MTPLRYDRKNRGAERRFDFRCVDDRDDDQPPVITAGQPVSENIARRRPVATAADDGDDVLMTRLISTRRLL